MDPDDLLAGPAVEAAVAALAERNRHHLEQMSDAERQDALGHWRELAITVLSGISSDRLVTAIRGGDHATLTKIPGIGKKTASVLLLFSFGMPLMPVDRHVERVSRRIGLLPRETAHTDPHDVFLAMLQPDQVYEAHVNLIRHGRLVCEALRPKHELCPVRERCRFVDPKAP